MQHEINLSNIRCIVFCKTKKVGLYLVFVVFNQHSPEGLGGGGGGWGRLTEASLSFKHHQPRGDTQIFFPKLTDGLEQTGVQR